MDAPLVFPQPREMSLGRERVVLAGKGEAVAFEFAPPDAALAKRAAEELRQALRKMKRRAKAASGGTAAITVEIADPADGDQEDYEIHVADGGAYVTASSARGALCAVRTLVQLLRDEGGALTLPQGDIRDWPAMRWRGAFAEATGATSSMSLDDWKELVDTHARLKMNMLMVGLYSCWRRVDHRKEYLLVPFKKHPDLRSSMTLEHFSAVRNERVKRDETPLMFEGDFLGELADYAAERGVALVPYFSALGHNTLIPRLVPETSMLAADGSPKGYGFCTSNPKTYEVLFGMFDEIVDRYMQPHNLDMFCIGMDEVRDFCECPKCKKANNKGMDNFMLRHALACAAHLKKRGVRRVAMWHDMVERGGMVNRPFMAKLKRMGLDKTLALAWWNYGDQRGLPELSPRKVYSFPNFRPDLGALSWAVPSAGWNFSMPLALSREGNIRSIMTHAQVAERDGAEAMSSYSCHDPIFHEGYVALAEYSWNPTATNDLRHFRERYYRSVFGDKWAEAGEMMDSAERAFAPWIDLFNAMFSRVYAKSNPGPHIASLPPDLCDKDKFVASMNALREAAAGLRGLAGVSACPKVVRMYASDADYAAGVLGVVLATLETVRDYRRARAEPNAPISAQRMAERCKDNRKAVAALKKAMAGVERTRAPFNAPYILNRATGLLDFAENFQGLCEKLLAEVKKGDKGTLPLFAHGLTGFYAENLRVKAL